MSGKSLEPEARRSLLQELASIPVDADTDDLVLSTFLPGPQHQRALDRRVLVVRGERGAGKTALFQLLHALERRNIPLSDVIRGAPEGRRIDGFSEEGTIHPPAPVIEMFAEKSDVETLRAFWLGHLAARLCAEKIGNGGLPKAFGSAYSAGLNDLDSWVPAARSAVPELFAMLDSIEAGMSETCFVVYDHLDRIGSIRREVREKAASALLGLWFSLSQRYDRIRGKILLREDVFQTALTSFTDATKLEARSVRLDWNAGRLFALLARRMAAYEGLQDWLREVPRIEFSRDKRLGWVPAPEFDERAQRDFGRALVGPYMGAGPTKGASHAWLINHLQDAHLRVTPRSLLQLVRGAAEVANERGPRGVYRRLLHPIKLQQSLEKASNRRVREVQEDYPVVGRLEGLRNATLFLSRREVVRALGTVDSVRDELGGDAQGAYDELLRIGVLSERQGSVDVPDVYRYNFGIKRKGGIRRVT